MRPLVRAIMVGLTIGVMMFIRPVKVETAELAFRISIFKDLVEAISAAGDAVTKVTDGFKHLIKSGVAGYDYVAARLTYEDLRELSATLGELSGSTTMVVDPINSYLKNPSPEEWDRLRERFKRVLLKVNSLLDRVKHNRSDFILEPAYEKLHTVLLARASLLESLDGLPPPITPEELDLLKQAQKRYEQLIKEVSDARGELNEYLKQHKPT